MEVDSLRDKIQSNHKLTNGLVARLQEALANPRLTLVAHKSYFRVLEVTKAHTAKTEKHPELTRQGDPVAC